NRKRVLTRFRRSAPADPLAIAAVSFSGVLTHSAWWTMAHSNFPWKSIDDGTPSCHLVSMRDRQPRDVLEADPCRCLMTQLVALLIRDDPLANYQVEQEASRLAGSGGVIAGRSAERGRGLWRWRGHHADGPLGGHPNATASGHATTSGRG